MNIGNVIVIIVAAAVLVGYSLKEARAASVNSVSQPGNNYQPPVTEKEEVKTFSIKDVVTKILS